ncbi:MAG: hypothetical protein CML68_13370 [Rhodobacteraceae bacterium]|nr:hypothetical protein [Paracoccaceae bacterium]
MKALQIAALAVLLPCAAGAENARCLPRDVLVQTLEKKYSETMQGGGLQNAQQLVEIWTSQSGSFTVFVTRADGFACIMATGQNWQSAAPAPTGDAL